jgi:hypothetical protein
VAQPGFVSNLRLWAGDEVEIRTASGGNAAMP